MFYSHEILTNRKYGVATVWLVATLGAKSGTRKITRKTILDVNVTKACETIIQPDAPMALRLQSNLLYGVSRVYYQQCDYVLHDAQVAHNHMRAMLRAAKNNDLDAAATIARPDQLMLMDDPAFNLDMPLPALDFGFSNGDLMDGGSQRSSQSMMSISRRSGSISSHGGSVLGINVQSSSSVGGYQLPSNDHFGPSSTYQNFGGTGRDIFNEEAELLEDDQAFEFDAQGNMRDIDIDEQQRRACSSRPRLGSDSAASAHVRKDHEDGAAGVIRPNIHGENDDFMNFDDDNMQLPDAEPFPAMSGGLGGKDKPYRLLIEDRVYSDEASSETVEAPQRYRKPKPKVRKNLASDQVTELRNSDLSIWQREYLDREKVEGVLKLDKKSKGCAKKNAFSFVWGAGLNDVGNGIGSSKIASPLEMFSGKALLAKITGVSPLLEQDAKSKKQSKHPLDQEEEQDESPKRARHTPEVEVEGEAGRGMPDYDEGLPMVEDSSIGEIGRDAASALQDHHHSSALMPWNVSQSLHSHRSIQGHDSQPRLRHRPTSASPLVGRGSNLPDDLQLDLMGDDDNDQAMYGCDQSPSFSNHNNDDAFLHRAPPSSSQAEAEFELFGPAAQVDTQTAGSSQWVREALDRESMNFFGYVMNSIEEKFRARGDGADLDENIDIDVDENTNEKEARYVTFEELFEPGENSQVVAAQAFYHVLWLATRGRVWVQQGGEIFGEIMVGV